MTGWELIELLVKAHRRPHLIGTLKNGVVAALGLEGRLFTIVNGTVINRVSPSAIKNRSNKNAYQNPGGDTLWPAPEGTSLGYEYTTGSWRVPPSITGAVWEVVSQTDESAILRAEIDLVNNQQLGIPCEFERHIAIEIHPNTLVQKVSELIRYIGKTPLHNEKFLLAPWSLCQFNSFPGGKVFLPVPGKDDIWDLYGPSDQQRSVENDKYAIKTETTERFQVSLSENIPWIEYVSGAGFSAKRYIKELPSEQSFIDIADAPPDQLPSHKGVKLSVYCDPSGFMEIEACGGCPASLAPGTELRVDVITEYKSFNP